MGHTLSHTAMMSGPAPVFWHFKETSSPSAARSYMKREKLVLWSPPTGVQHMVCVGVPTRTSPYEHTPGAGGAVATHQPHTSNRYSPPVVMWMVVGSARIMPLAAALTTLSGILANSAPTSKSCLNIAGPHTGVATADLMLSTYHFVAAS